jgi:DNA-binding NtrC family response regulator
VIQLKSKIVVIDDEIKLLKVIKRALEIDGYEVYDFSNPFEGLEFIKTRESDLVISDIRMNGMTGLDILSNIRDLYPDKPVILMTAYSSVDTAVTAVKLGASDYLLKPFELSDLKESVSKILAKKSENEAKASNVPTIIGNSAEILKIQEIIDNISDTDSTILITGESGTGKELIAKCIHQKSPRASHAFVPVNCSAIPESLFESEMFGHKKGSFTGAIMDKKGLFKEAEGGTLFLDEIGDLPLATQAKLLRVLQDGTYRPVGASGQNKSNVRILCATNKNLAEEVKKGNFREDLLYRINVVEIELPPLRKRNGDIKLLAEYFISYYSKKHNRKIKSATPDFFELLSNYKWPGNIRQLENSIERAVIMRKSEILDSSDLRLPTSIEESSSLTIPDTGLPLAETIDKVEISIINQALKSTGGNYSKAASLLGITRQNLNYKLHKYNIRKEDQ